MSMAMMMKIMVTGKRDTTMTKLFAKLIKLTFSANFLFAGSIFVPEVLPISSFASGDTAFAESKRYKKKKRRKKRRKRRHSAHHGHSHRHSHSHKKHDHGLKPGFTLTAGASLATSFGGNSQGSDGSGSEGAGHVEDGSHSHLALTQSGHEGHDHRGGGEGGSMGSGGDSSGGLGLSLIIGPGYRFNKNWSLISSLGFSQNGITDPAAGLAYTLPVTTRLSNVFSATASAPLSEASQNSGQITAITGSISPTYNKGKWTVSASLSYTKNWYSEPLIVEEGDSAKARVFGLQDDHDHEGEEGHNDHEQNNSQPGSNDLNSHEDDHDNREHSEGEHHDGEVSDRQSSSIASNFTIGYRIYRKLQAAVALNLTQSSSALGRESYYTEARLLQLNYSLNSWTLGGWFSMSGSGGGIASPTNPGGGVSVGYSL